MSRGNGSQRFDTVRYSVAAFFILAVALGGITIYLVVQGILPSGVALASVSSASIAGIIMTAIEDGRAGLKLMLRRLLIWRVGIGYWLFAFLFLVPAVLLGSMANTLFNGDPLSFSNMKPALGVLPLFIIFFIVSGLGQELGWTGFLTPRLQARFGALTSCVIRAILSSLWHLPLLLYSRRPLPALSDFPYSGWIAQKGFLVAMEVQILMFLVPWSIFYTWMFNNTRGEPASGCRPAWFGDLACFLDAERRDRYEEPGQLLGLWCSPGGDRDHHCHRDRRERSVTKVHEDCSLILT